MDKKEDISNIRHTLSHILAASVLDLYPNTKTAIGPTTESGFYYDFDFENQSIKEEDLKKIEKQMRKIMPSFGDLKEEKISKKEAKKYFANNPYKLELIEELDKAGEDITFYSSKKFTDLCKGGHVKSVKNIPKDCFVLSSIAGAYWRGDENKKMLTRIYGLAFSSKKELSEHQKKMEEAKKRDHRKLGKELGLFVFSDKVGPGLPLYTPKGLILLNEIKDFSRKLRKSMGYQEVQTPQINRRELFEISGHYQKYREDMFSVHSNYTDEEYYLKPMNCPQHTQLYASELRSYRDLPYRVSDHSLLYRDEKPGELSGLTRLRSFSQDDAHCFCTEEHLKEEFTKLLNAVKKAMDKYGMNYYIRFSTRDENEKEKYLGDDEVWESSQTQIESLLKELQIKYELGEGEAAFYGPKMDLMAKDVLGREWQLSTIQLDMNMPKRFKLEYTDKDGSKKTPLMIHSALVGSPERFLGVLIENYAGAFPFWISPVQIKIIPIDERHNEYAKKIHQTLQKKGYRSEINSSDENMSKKIRRVKQEKLPYFLVIGDSEVKNKTVTLEGRDGKEGEKTEKELLDFLKNLL